jgi:hypothetical protein
VLLVPLAVVLGVALALARPSMGARAARPAIHRAELIPVGAGLALVAASVRTDLAPVLTAASLVALLAVVAANAHLTGLLVVGVGLLANLTAVALHQGMPVRAEALVVAGVVEAGELGRVDLTGPRRLERPSDVAPVLGDVLPIPGARLVVSFGDLIVLAGVLDLTAEVARRRRRRWSDDRRENYREVAATRARVDQLWGTAPSPAAVSGSQCSANPEAMAPSAIDLRRDASRDAAEDPVEEPAVAPDPATADLVATQHR